MLVKRAEEFARLVHRNQSYGELSYSEHLKEVYLTLLDFGITDDNILAASWLHDCLEDYSIDSASNYETLVIQFGKEVTDLVQAVTNEKGTNRKEILEKTALKIKDNEAALVIKLADRIVNTEFSIDNNKKLYKMYEKEFPRFRELLYKPITTLGDFSFTLIRMWDYLENLYVDEESRLLSGELLEISERKFNHFVDDLAFKSKTSIYSNLSDERYEK